MECTMDSTAIARDTICPRTRAHTCRNTRETTQCSDWVLVLKHHNNHSSNSKADVDAYGEKEIRIKIKENININSPGGDKIQTIIENDAGILIV